MDKHLEPQPPSDAFTLWSLLRGFPRYNEMAVAQLDPLRRANSYKLKIIAIPEVNPESSSGTVIPAFNRYQYQFRVAPGSWVYGLAANLSLPTKISTSCSGGPINMEFVGMSMANGFSARQPIMLLDQPLCVLGDGLVDVDIANNTAEDVLNSAFQLLIFVASATDYTTELVPGVSTPLR